jgi:hypothetical protein
VTSPPQCCPRSEGLEPDEFVQEHMWTRIAAHACAGTRFSMYLCQASTEHFSNALNFRCSAIAAFVRSP